MKSPPERAASDRVWLDWDLWEPDITRGSVEFAMSCSDRSRDRYTQHASDSTRMMGPRCGILSYLRWAGKVKKMSSRVIALYFDNSRLGQIHGLETARPRSFHTWWDVRVCVSWQCWHSFYYAIFVSFLSFCFFFLFSFLSSQWSIPLSLVSLQFVTHLRYNQLQTVDMVVVSLSPRDISNFAKGFSGSSVWRLESFFFPRLASQLSLAVWDSNVPCNLLSSPHLIPPTSFISLHCFTDSHPATRDKGR